MKCRLRPLSFCDVDYAELLGLYLGDGHISELARTQRLRICLDSRYPAIVSEADALLRRCFPCNLVGRVRFHDGADVLTIEGVAQGGRLHPVQEAFIAHDGLQCGYCTPGQIMSAIGLIHEGQAGDDPERIREGMSGNLCRCAAYQGITAAVLQAQRTLDAASRKEVA